MLRDSWAEGTAGRKPASCPHVVIPRNVRTGAYEDDRRAEVLITGAVAIRNRQSKRNLDAECNTVDCRVGLRTAGPPLYEVLFSVTVLFRE